MLLIIECSPLFIIILSTTLISTLINALNIPPGGLLWRYNFVGYPKYGFPYTQHISPPDIPNPNRDGNPYYGSTHFTSHAPNLNSPVYGNYYYNNQPKQLNHWVVMPPNNNFVNALKPTTNYRKEVMDNEHSKPPDFHNAYVYGNPYYGNTHFTNPPKIHQWVVMPGDNQHFNASKPNHRKDTVMTQTNDAENDEWKGVYDEVISSAVVKPTDLLLNQSKLRNESESLIDSLNNTVLLTTDSLPLTNGYNDYSHIYGYGIPYTGAPYLNSTITSLAASQATHQPYYVKQFQPLYSRKTKIVFYKHYLVSHYPDHVRVQQLEVNQFQHFFTIRSEPLF